MELNDLTQSRSVAVERSSLFRGTIREESELRVYLAALGQDPLVSVVENSRSLRTIVRLLYEPMGTHRRSSSEEVQIE